MRDTLGVRTTWDGRPIAREAPFGATVVVWRDNPAGREWLVLHRAHHGPDYAGEWAWTPPSGARQPGESIDECARRELREETGLDLAPEPVDPGEEWALYTAAAPPDAEVRVDPEHDAFAWLSLDEACARCRPQTVADAIRVVAAR